MPWRWRSECKRNEGTQLAFGKRAQSFTGWGISDRITLPGEVQNAPSLASERTIVSGKMAKESFHRGKKEKHKN